MTNSGLAMGSARARRWLRWAMAFYVVYALTWVGLVYPWITVGVDYDKHWQAARALVEGRSVYLGGNLWLGFNYPQATAMLFAWLAPFTLEAGEHAWKLFLWAVMVVTGALAWRGYRPAGEAPEAAALAPHDRAFRGAARRRWGLLAAFAVASYQPATSCLHLGNIDPWNAFLAVAVVAALLAGRERLAGVAWALFMLVKMMPVALTLPFALWRRWRVLGAALALGAVYLVVLLATGRVADELYFVREAVPLIPRYWRYISFGPTRAVLHGLGLGALYENPYGFEFATCIGSAAMLALFVALNAWLLGWPARGRTLRLALAAPRVPPVPFIRALEPIMLAYPLLSPLLEYHHYVWCLPVLLLQLRRWAAGAMHPIEAGGLLLGWVLLNLAYHLMFQFSKWGTGVQFLPMLAMALLLGFTMWSVRRERGRPLVE